MMSQGNNSGSGGRLRPSYDEQTLQPLTVHMALTSKPDPSSSDGTGSLQDERKLYHVKIVGAVRSVDDFSTNVVYKIEDGTGIIDVKLWLDGNEPAALMDLREQTKKEKIYVKVVGQIKDYDGVKMIVADSIRPLSTGNELAHHMLEVVYSSEQAKQNNECIVPPPNLGVGFGSASGAPLVAATGGTGEEALRAAVLDFFKVRGRKSQEGASVQDCITHLCGQYTEGEIRRAIDYHSSEGDIYITSSEDYFKCSMD